MSDNLLYRNSYQDTERKADYSISYMNDSVFIDFINLPNELVCLVRISFDGYGCCNLNSKAIPLNKIDSKDFKLLFYEDELNQAKLFEIIKKAIVSNKDNLWIDALLEYNLIDND